MATKPQGTFLTASDDKAINLVRKIAQKTRERKVGWQRVATGLRASVGGRMELFFALGESSIFSILLTKPGLAPPPEPTATVPLTPPGVPVREWTVFLVRGEGGKEILKVAPLSPVLGILQMGPSEALLNEIDNLFRLATEGATSELDKAIQFLDTI